MTVGWTNREYDDTDYGSEDRWKRYADRMGIGKSATAESSPSYIKDQKKKFRKREAALAKKARRRNSGGIF